MGRNTDGEDILSHPEVVEVRQTVFEVLGEESDRGAVLVSGEIVNDHLGLLFRETADPAVSNTLLKRLLMYPGPLSTFSARADVGLAVGLIPEATHKSITALRRLRNDAAHSHRQFNLHDHWEQLTKVLKLGDGVPEFVSRTIAHILAGDALEKANTVSKQFEEETGELLFATQEELIDFFRDSSKVMASLRQKQPKYELGFGVSLICGVLVHSRERNN